MKKNYFLLICLFTISLFAVAQPTLTQANFIGSIGDSTLYYAADTNTTTVDPTIGANVIFDYDSIISLNLTQTNYILDPTGTPGASDFPSADFAEKASSSNTNYVYSKIFTDSLANIGFIADITGFGEVTATYDDPEVIMKFPFNYGDSYTNAYSGTFSTLFNGFIPVTTNGAGSVTVEADAWGTLLLPNAVMIDSVIRVKRVEQVITDAIIIPPPFSQTIDPLTIDATVISYYKPSESKAAIMSFIEGAYSQNGSVVASNKTIISQYPLVIGVKEYELANEVKLYPNPSANGTTTLSFKLKNASTVSIQLLNNLGQLVENVYSGKLPSGTNRYDISTAQFSRGVYFVNILVDDAKMTQKLIVE